MRTQGLQARGGIRILFEAAGNPFDLTDLATANINNDGIDDIIAIGVVGTPAVGKVSAIPIGVPAANGTLVTDAQCQ